MTVSDNTIAAERLVDLFKKLGGKMTKHIKEDG